VALDASQHLLDARLVFGVADHRHRGGDARPGLRRIRGAGAFGRGEIAEHRHHLHEQGVEGGTRRAVAHRGAEAEERAERLAHRARGELVAQVAEERRAGGVVELAGRIEAADQRADLTGAEVDVRRRGIGEAAPQRLDRPRTHRQVLDGGDPRGERGVVAHVRELSEDPSGEPDADLSFATGERVCRHLEGDLVSVLEERLAEEGERARVGAHLDRPSHRIEALVRVGERFDADRAAAHLVRADLD
jgi:hypothetical protein